MTTQQRIEKANEIASTITTKFDFWDTSVWQKNDMVRVYVNFNSKSAGFVDVSENGIKSQMKTLRDTNRINELLG